MSNLNWQDIGSTQQWTQYDLAFTGEDLEGLKAFVLKEVKRRGVEPMTGLAVGKENGKWIVSMRVRSSKGIV